MLKPQKMYKIKSLKGIILLAIFLLPFCATSQDRQDSLVSLQRAIEYNRDLMYKYTDAYFGGVTVMCVGFVFSGFSFLIPETRDAKGFDTNSDYRNGVLIGGAAVSLIGEIMMISSHRWVRKAHQFRFTGNGFELAIPDIQTRKDRIQTFRKRGR